jgi:hypothetical protein
MDAMRDALKQKRMSYSPPPPAADPSPADGAPEQEGSDLKDLVQSLSEDQKAELLGLLQKDAGQGESDSKVETGAASDDESKAVDDEISEQDQGDDSDDIAMSMLDSKAKMGQEGVQPRNLGERVRMAMAQKLKGKGKL